MRRHVLGFGSVSLLTFVLLMATIWYMQPKFINRPQSSKRQDIKSADNLSVLALEEAVLEGELYRQLQLTRIAYALPQEAVEVEEPRRRQRIDKVLII